MTTIDPFNHLETRCCALIARYIDPLIQVEKVAAAAGGQVPIPDFDSMAAFRLLVHAELENYFEDKAAAALERLQDNFSKNAVMTEKLAALIFLHIWKQKKIPSWTAATGDDQAIRAAELVDFKRMAQEALGYGRQYIKDNNGIKETSIQTMSALMGYFKDELDGVLVTELNQYGKMRGDVAHRSWVNNTRTFLSPQIEKDKLEVILKLTKDFYEQKLPLPVGESNALARWVKKARALFGKTRPRRMGRA